MLFHQPLARLSLALALAWTPASLVGQTPTHEPIAALLVDANDDFLADRLGQSACAQGIVTAAPYAARRDRELRIYLQDDSAGIRCIATDHQLLASVEPGDLLAVAGVLEHYRGMEQLHVESVERIRRVDVPDPVEADVAAVASERMLGQLVTVTAQIAPPVLSTSPILQDESGATELYMPRRFLDDPALIQRLAAGGTCTVIGYAEQNDASAPYDAGYRLRLRSPQDLQLAPSSWVESLLAIALASFAGAVVVLLSARRFRAKRGAPRTWAEPIDRIQGQKMEALGTLAGGIAHEFNNYLAAIRGYTELASASLEGDREAQEHLAEVLTTSDKAKELADKILTFSRKEEAALADADVADVVREGLSLIRATLPASVELQSEIDPYAGVVQASPNQLHQVLLNLASNAVDAMRQSGGVLRVQVDRVMIEADQAATLGLAAAGCCARITVADDGPGMDAATLERMYEPFFTTKDIGVGTGLGLSIVHNILKHHGAGIRVTSAAKTGTRFEIFLRASEECQGPEAPSEAPINAHSTAPTSTPSEAKRVLFVDDTENLARLGRRQLAALGYDAQIATDGAQALEKFANASPPIDAVVTDYRMPGISGLELAEKLQQLRPGIAVLMVTGYGHFLTPEQVAAAGVHKVIKKPYARDDLGRALRSALDRG
ncbi:MAG: ATP-binding protein [Planctomycetota bacterium]|nr:ATP-binding protein [Planctomycetota bacterium]